ncbi:monovalent cation/H(+) antiporter subunit G [Arenibaculum pallidiluteum]|uniref:monovalent cation/H(+) antiporter subunit G n=1 Tax=Arenibaculum pallidiluteum TaxID=2812559 RepID=UPI001A971534|nr:monovalent cation/H(+) antiporter subunit G [Arenibaculum pallidiluteum]
MNPAADIPLWVAVPTALLLLLGAGLALVGSLGLLRLGSFYERIHAPTLGTTLGIASVLAASMLYFSALQTRPVLHEILIGIFMVVTTPVTLMLLARAALYRDRTEGSRDVPLPSPPPQRPGTDASAPDSVIVQSGAEKGRQGL